MNDVTTAIVRFAADSMLVGIALVAVVAMIAAARKRNRYQDYVRVGLAGLTSYLVAKFAGFVYQPETLRPFEKMGVEPGAAYLNNPGFPSDHALFAMYLVLAVWFMTRNVALVTVLGIAMIAMCVARVLALVHTPTDVIGGLLIGCVGAVWYVGARQNVKKVVK